MLALFVVIMVIIGLILLAGMSYIIYATVNGDLDIVQCILACLIMIGICALLVCKLIMLFWGFIL